MQHARLPAAGRVAQAAADALRRIFPLAQSRGLALSIPMPGHAPASPAHEQAMREAAQQLDALVAEHDAAFLLTDTRESRRALPAILHRLVGWNAHDHVWIVLAA